MSRAAKATRPARRAARAQPESGQVRILTLPLRAVRPSPENEELYRPVDPEGPEVVALAEAIVVNGVLEPLVVTADGFILSGHRRRVAAELAGLAEVPCRVMAFKRLDDPSRFRRLLRQYNNQRVKTRDEQLRETVVDLNPDLEYEALVDHRASQVRPPLPALRIEGVKRRAELTSAKAPMLAAVRKILQDLREHLPLSDRQIHYQLLNDPPLRHAGKPDSTYDNTLQSYKSLCDLLTRARIAGLIPWEAIADETRPVEACPTFRDVGAYVRRELDIFLKSYWRDLMQSQPDHLEIVGEKNPVGSILRPVASRYTITLTTGRGYCSSPPRRAMAERFRRSGKAHLVVLILSDFDPDGQEIAHSFARSMRDDFGIREIHPVKVALTADQVRAYNLPPVMKAKPTSAHHAKFTARHGDDVFELEALPPAELQWLLKDAIERAIDREAFNAELEAERQDSLFPRRGTAARGRRARRDRLRRREPGRRMTRRTRGKARRVPRRDRPYRSGYCTAYRKRSPR